MKNAETQLKEAWNNVNIPLLQKKISWALRAPRCSCESCFQSWETQGAILYSGNLSPYREVVKRERHYLSQVR